MKFTKGLVLDSTNEDRPEGSWAHALNALFNQEIGAATKEGGAVSTWDTGSDLYVLGTGTYQDITIIFAYIANIGAERIYKFDGSNDSIALIFSSPGSMMSSCLERVAAGAFGWTQGTQIKAVCNRNTKDELIVYWISDDFPPCVLNVDKQKSLIDSGAGTSSFIYESDISVSCDIRWIDQLRLAPHAGPVPRIITSKIIPGGTLEVATYTLALQYIMDDGSSTGNLLTSLAVAVPLPATNQKNLLITGSDSFDKSTAPVQTGQAIRWELDNINTVNVKYIQPYIIKNSGNAEVGLKLTKIEIATEVDPVLRELDIVYEGMEGEALADINEIFNGNLVYSRAKAIEQFDDKLYLANLEIDPIIRYQKYANAITLRPAMEDICDFDPRHKLNDTTCMHYVYNNDIYEPAGLNPGSSNVKTKAMNSRSYRNDDYHTHKKGYKRGEVYAFYIAFIKADGSMTPAYHIPGRHPIMGVPGGVGYYPETVNQVWMYQPGWALPGSEGMNYWQNQDEYYPNNDDFDTVDITSGTAVVGLSNRSKVVRHHHFPTGHHVDYEAGGEGWSGASPWAVIQNGANTNQPSLSAITDTVYNQMGTNAITWTDPLYGTPWSVNGPNTTVTLAILVDLNNWGHNYGDPDAYQVGVSCNIWNMQNNGVLIFATAGPVIQVLITHRIDTYQGQGNIVYLECTFTLPNTDLLFQNHWLWPTMLPDSDNPFIGNNQDNGTWVPIGNGNYTISADHSWMNQFDTCMAPGCDEQAVNILGFRLKDLAIPKDIADQVQGFRIYRAERKEGDRTRIDQGLAANVHEEEIKLNNKNPKSTLLFQVPFYGIDGPGYYRDSAHYNKYYGMFAFYGFESLRTRKSLNEASSIDTIYSMNEASTLSVRGPEISVPGYPKAEIKFKNDTSVDAYLTDDSGDVGCYDPWAWGFLIDGPGVGLTQPSWFSSASATLGGGSIWSSNGDASKGDVGATGLYTGCYHFLSAYDQVWQGLDQLYPRGTDFNINTRITLLSNRLEYIQGNTIESLRDHHEADYAYNMGACSYVLGGQWGQTTYESSIIRWDGDFTAGYPNASNPGSMYHNYIGNSITSGDIDYGGGSGNFLGPTYNESFRLLKDEINDPMHSHFRIVDVYSERRNVYNDYDTQNLIFTGFEVLGEEINRFIVDVENGTPSVAHSQDLYPFNNQTGKIFGGDTFIVREDIRITYDGYDLTNPIIAEQWLLGTGVSVISGYGIGANCVRHTAGAHNAIVSIIVESNENIALRHSNTASTTNIPESSIHKLLFALDGICIGLGSSCFTSNGWLSEDAAYIHTWDQNPCLPTDLTNHKTGTNANGEEGIRYNEVFHYNNLLGNPIPVSNSIEEILTYPVRVTRSITGGGVSDTYRNFPELDFMDVQTDRGSIWNLFIHTGVLMIQSEDGLYKTKGSETLNTEQGGDIFVGSGNIFANAPELVATANLGVGGTTLRFSNYSTKWGYFYIDYNRRTVNHFGETLTIISDKGLREWMQINIPISLYDYGIPQDDEFTNTLFGFALGLDARHNRLLITKRSYNPTDAFITAWNTNNSGDGHDIRWQSNTGDPLTAYMFQIYMPAPISAWVPISWTDTTYLLPDNWTLSYYPEEQIWGSFHSYWPSTYICHDNEIYAYGKSPGYSGVLYKHNSPDMSRYGIYHVDAGFATNQTLWPFEVMQSFNKDNLSNKLFYALNVDTRWTNELGAVEHNIGLTHYFAHTDVQTTGMRELNYNETYRGVGGSWQINDLRDRSLLGSEQLQDNPVITDHWSLLNLYNQPMFVDSNLGYQELNPLYVAVGAAWAINWSAPWNPGDGNYTPGLTVGYSPTSLSPNSTGSGMVIDFLINGVGLLTNIIITSPGTGYQDGEVFSIPGSAQTPASLGTGITFTIYNDKPWQHMRRIRDRYINIFLRDDNSVKNSLTLLDSSILYKEWSR